MPTYSNPFLLSDNGSTRATAYNWGNKALTIEDRTHVVWLDAVSQVCARTYDHSSGQWGDTARLFEGCDNHANPSITADREGKLRLVYGPHGWWGDWNQARVKWAISEERNRIDTWASEETFGYNATAASIVHSPEGLDLVVCRGGESPASTMFHRQREAGGWTSARELFCQDIEPQYTHHYGHIACHADGTIYAACHFYNVGGGHIHPVTGSRAAMRTYGMAVIKSTDLGETWTDLRGSPVTTPTQYEARIAIPPVGADMYVDSIALDSAGTVWALAKHSGLKTREVLLSHWSREGWETTPLEDSLPEGLMAVDGAMTLDSQDRVHVVLTALDPEQVEGDAWWGHPSCEIYHLFSADGAKSFECNLVSVPDPEKANWLPSLPKLGPFHPVDRPLILYTHGNPGEGCAPQTVTEVWGVFSS